MADGAFWACEMKRYLWVVEMLEGDEWVFTGEAFASRAQARLRAKWLCDFRPVEQAHRVVKYTPAE